MNDADISVEKIEKQQTLLKTELKLPKIRTSNQELVEFNPKHIYDVYIDEAGLDAETAEYYTQLIMADLNKLYIQNRLHELSTRMLRELMCAHAIQQGDFATRNRLSVLGLPIKDAESLFFNYNSENSNHVPSEEFIHKAMADVMNEQYSFSTLYNINTPWGNPAYAHMNADIYIHDRDYPARPFCLSENEMVLAEINGKLVHKRIGELLSGEFRNIEGWLACNKFKVLSFDFKEYKQVWIRSRNIVKKKSEGEIVNIGLEGGRKADLDPRHMCIVLRQGKFETVLASDVLESDFFPIFTHIELPEKNTEKIDIIESGIKGVYVKGAQMLIEKAGKTHKELAKVLNVSKSTVTAWHRDNGIPVEKFLQLERLAGVRMPRAELKLSAAGGSQKAFNASVNADNALMDFLGYYVAEGHCKKCGKMKIALNMKTEADVAHYLKGIIPEITGIEAKLEWDEKHSVVNVVTDSFVMNRFLEALGCGRVAREKKVPEIVWNVSGKKRQRFIKSLFKGDGHIKNRFDKTSRSSKEITRAQYTTVSDQLATGYAMLLASEGISTHSGFQQKYNAHRVHVDMGRSTAAFSDLIGYEAPVLTSGSIAFSNLIPISMIPENADAKAKGIHKISIEKLMQYDVPENIKKIISSGVRFAKVKSVKKEMYCGYFYCFETENGVISHGNGIISHNCFQHSARFIFRNGLYIDGTGRHVNVSRPPKNLEVAIRQVCEFLGAASRNWNGGQSFRNLFWELGPFLESAVKSNPGTKNLGGVEIPSAIAQAAQMMRYEPNHILVGRGSQAAFSSLSNFAVPPKYLTEGSDIVLPGGAVIKGSYADYREYVLKFWYAYLFESARGDANGGMFHWMKDDIGIKPAWFNDPDLQQYVFEPLMKYVAKFGGPYVYNVKNVSDDEVACTSCCSLVLQSESPDDFELARQGTLGMGALQCGSFNLPRIAYLANGSDAKVYELIESRMNLLSEVMKAKKAFMQKILATGVAPFLTQPRLRGKDTASYFDIEKQSYLMSFCGMNEFTKAHLGYELHESKDAHNFAMKLLLHMINYTKKLSEETGLNMAIWRQPGETMPGKFAQDDYKKFNGKAVLQGNPKAGAAYYSNFTHTNVNSGISVFDKIKNESPFHALSPSNLLHIWLGEAQPDPSAMWDMTKKILDKSLTTYFAFTKEITVCNNCKTSHPGVVAHCACGAGPKDLVVNSRIVGYYSAVGTVEAILNWRKSQSRESLKGAYWQPHKFAEFHNRVANYSGARLSKLEALKAPEAAKA